MISVVNRDGRKGLGLDFCGGGGEMEETELEEGEACDYQDDDSNIDPDVDLSYLDEKVQVVLGHFQKDFEGGVSAENLGAKFGGYGSFLPTYQRSPSIWSQPKTPQKVQSYETPRSPSNLQMEGDFQNSAVPSGATSSMKLEPASTSGVPPPVSRGPFLDNSSKRDLIAFSSKANGECNPNNQSFNKQNNLPDQKTLKVRLKVGSDNMAQKTAAIFSGLGLDISPSSSPEDSPFESGGFSPESRESPDESPTSILQIMTSSPVPGGLLLSPLPDTLLHLMEKEKHLRDSRSGLVCKDSQGSSSMSVDESFLLMGEGKHFGEKKMKLVENRSRAIEVKNGIVKDVGNGFRALFEKEIDIETPEGRELVSNSLKLPILSNAKLNFCETAKGTGLAPEVSGEAKKRKAKEKFISSDIAKDSESITSQDVNTGEKLKPRTSSGDKDWEDRKEKVRKDVQISPRKDGKSTGNKYYDPCKVDLDNFKGKEYLYGGTLDPSEDKVNLKAAFHDEDGGKFPYRKEQTLSGGKKKSKGSKNHGNSATEFPKESLRVVSSAASKDKKKSNSDSSSKNKLDDSKLRRESVKTRESYRDLFGDAKMEPAENSMNSLEMPSIERPKEYNRLDVIEKETHQFADKSKERPSSKDTHQLADKSKERPSGKKVENPLTSEVYPKAGQIVAPIGNGTNSDAAPAIVAPVVIEENWVCCDRCQKWRLLPYGTNPDHLPKKWLCNMLNWLPGMNRCNISEEETTKALNALYQIPAPEGQNNLQSQPNGAAPGVTLSELQHLDPAHQEHNLHGVLGGGKKKHGSKEIGNATSFMGPASLKSRSLNDVNQSPSHLNLANKAGNQHLSKSSDSTVGKHRHKQKEKHKLAQDGDHPKIKSKREADQDGFRASKKIKTEGLCNAEEEWNSDYGGIMGNSGPTSINSLSAKATGKDVKNFGEDSSSKDSKCDMKDNLPAATKKAKALVQVSLDDGALDMGNFDKKDIAAKKRKVKEWQESQVYPSETLADAGHHLEVNKVSLKEGTSESEHKKEKKARVSKSEVKETHKSMGNARTDKRERSSQTLISSSRVFASDEMEESRYFTEKDHQVGQYHMGNNASEQMLDCVDPLKRDSGFGLPPLAATSSSSKVSGSRKSKANFQEAKGSPVESVSSSPLRSDKGTSGRRIILGKDDATNVGFSVMGSHRRCSDGEGDAGSGRSGTARKEKAPSVVHHGSLESSVLDYQDREVNPTSGGKVKSHTEPSCYEFGNPHLVNGGADTLEQHIQQVEVELQAKEHGHDEERANKHYGSNGSLSRNSGKGSSLRSKDKQRSSKSDVEKGKVKVSDSFIEQEELYPTKNSKNEVEIEPKDLLHHEESRGGKYNLKEKYGGKGGKDEKSYSGKKEYLGKWSNEGRRENQSKFGGNDGTDVKLSATCSKDGKSNSQQNFLKDRAGERSSHRSLSDRSDQLETAVRRGKSQMFPHSGDKQETQARCPRPVSGTHKGNGSDVLPVGASNGGGGDELKVSKQPKKPDNLAGAFHNGLRHSTPGRVVVDLDGPSPVRKDSASQAASNALREATDLKHSADRLKNSGSDLSTSLYFQAVLKFLYGASLLEPCHVESSRHGEAQSMHVYSTTASLCEFVAHEYERCKEMAAAALAYKCMEVAYMRVVYFKHSSANKDRLELQGALQMVPPGESPSSSASDVDNLNNQSTADKVALARGVGSPHVAGNHVIAARNRPNFLRLLNYTQDVNSAMEASRKSQNAFAAANANLEESQYEGISSVKRVLDFNFHDVQGLLRLVRLAMEAISR